MVEPDGLPKTIGWFRDWDGVLLAKPLGAFRKSIGWFHQNHWVEIACLRRATPATGNPRKIKCNRRPVKITWWGLLPTMLRRRVRTAAAIHTPNNPLAIHHITLSIYREDRARRIRANQRLLLSIFANLDNKLRLAAKPNAVPEIIFPYD